PIDPIEARSWMRLESPAAVLVARAMGSPTRAVITTIPTTVPTPKSATYESAISGDRIVEMTKSVSAALPASPWTTPMMNGRRPDGARGRTGREAGRRRGGAGGEKGGGARGAKGGAGQKRKGGGREKGPQGQTKKKPGWKGPWAKTESPRTATRNAEKPGGR